jgi:acetyltransferase-like isoleucine patch superfamily enzyme
MDPSSSISDFSGLVEHQEGLPPWWSERQNRLFLPPGSAVPPIECHEGLELPFGAMVVIRTADSNIVSIILWGDEPEIYIGDRCTFQSLGLACEGGSRIHIDGRFSVGENCTMDARNGGSITIGEYGLWANQVRAVTDDMHGIFDIASGERINRRGSHVRIDRHVWLGLQALVLPGAEIGEDCVIGARSVVSGSLPPKTLCVGAPARVIREGITWHIEDRERLEDV